MAKHLNTILAFLSTFFSFVAFGQQDKEPLGYMRREHSLIKPFSGKFVVRLTSLGLRNSPALGNTSSSVHLV